MEQICPFCGGELTGAAPGQTPGTRCCPACGQEVDQPTPPPPGVTLAATPPEEPGSAEPPADDEGAPPAGYEPVAEAAPEAVTESAPDAATGAATEAAPEAVYHPDTDADADTEPAGATPPPAPGAAATPPPGGASPYASPAQGADACGANAYMAQHLGADPGHHPDAPAWEGDAGFIARLWRTIWQVMLHPARTFTPPGRPGLAWAFSFGLILGTLGGAAQIFWSHALGGLGDTGSPVWAVIMTPLGAAAAIFVVTVLAHLFLVIFGAAKKGFTATFRVVAYGQALGILYLVPKVGAVVAFFWGIVIMVGGLAAAHGASRARVFWALVIPGLVLALLLVGLLIGLLGLGALMAALDMSKGVGTAL